MLNKYLVNKWIKMMYFYSKVNIGPTILFKQARYYTVSYVKNYIDILSFN